ncbi:unnamed protein product [Schistosoma mattheei]|uniref:Uncharacterized protein n=1 Tax=Schistosoma mattheei TaxID=31246 RepID=A0AA85AQC7_9TREM|nr:unnamed protein product [Schistosoma mattheei]
MVPFRGSDIPQCSLLISVTPQFLLSLVSYWKEITITLTRITQVLDSNLKTTPRYNSNVLYSLVVLYKHIICGPCIILPDESGCKLVTSSF